MSKTKLVFQLLGNTADNLIQLNFIKYISEEFEDIEIFVNTRNKTILNAITAAQSFVSFDKTDYDDCVSILLTKSCIIDPRSINVKYMNKKLKKYIEDQIKIQNAFETQHFFTIDSHNLFEFNLRKYAFVKNKTRTNIFDFGNLLNMPPNWTADFILAPDLNAVSTNIISISSVDRIDDSEERGYYWPYEKYKNLVDGLKMAYPSFEIITLGDLCLQGVKNVPIDCSNPDSMKTVLSILKNSALHIDYDGDLVQIRNLISEKPTVAMIGPAPGYCRPATCQTVCSKTCIGCANVQDTWRTQCIRGDFTCSRDLPQETVMQAVKHILSTYKMD